MTLRLWSDALRAKRRQSESCVDFLSWCILKMRSLYAKTNWSSYIRASIEEDSTRYVVKLEISSRNTYVRTLMLLIVNYIRKCANSCLRGFQVPWTDRLLDNKSKLTVWKYYYSALNSNWKRKNAVLHVKPWMQCILAVKAPYQDLCFPKSMKVYENVNVCCHLFCCGYRRCMGDEENNSCFGNRYILSN